MNLRNFLARYRMVVLLVMLAGAVWFGRQTGEKLKSQAAAARVESAEKVLKRAPVKNQASAGESRRLYLILGQGRDAPVIGNERPLIDVFAKPVVAPAKEMLPDAEEAELSMEVRMAAFNLEFAGKRSSLETILDGAAIINGEMVSIGAPLTTVVFYDTNAREMRYPRLASIDKTGVTLAGSQPKKGPPETYRLGFESGTE